MGDIGNKYVMYTMHSVRIDVQEVYIFTKATGQGPNTKSCKRQPQVKNHDKSVTIQMLRDYIKQQPGRLQKEHNKPCALYGQ